ncbi:MAG TPA: magnesium transporter [Acidimicrobiia bacterium]|nr:magnesium transporter [Acidimicrobiia bacterium]
MRLRLRSPRQLAHQLLAVARRDHDQVADYLDANREEWEALALAAPSDAADIIEQLDEEDAIELLSHLPPADAAEILEEIAPELAAELVERYPLPELAAALNEMTSEAAADLIGELDEEVTEDVLAAMADEVEDEVRDLLLFPPDSAGGLMTTDIAALPLGLTTGEAIERIRQLHEEYEDLSYVYVVDEEDRLQGVISFRDLVFRRPGAPLADVMVPDPVSVGTMTDREEVSEIAQRYHLFGVPVTDDAGRLVGMVTTEAVIEAIQDEATEDFAAAVGAGVAETVYTNVTSSFRMRLPWLALNLLLALVVAFVIEHQTGVISQEPVLAALMPVVALLGGNGGNQSLAVMIRSLASDDVPSAQVPSILGRQLGVGVLNGAVLGILAGAVCWLLIDSGLFETNSDVFDVSLVVAVSAFSVLLIGAVVGGGIPVLLRRFGLDPALASSIFLTLITDTVGFGGFLLLAGWFL